MNAILRAAMLNDLNARRGGSDSLAGFHQALKKRINQHETIILFFYRATTQRRARHYFRHFESKIFAIIFFSRI